MMWEEYMDDPSYIAFINRQNRLDERTTDKLLLFIKMFFGR